MLTRDGGHFETCDWQHVLCEKPMCVTFEETKELVNLARVKAKTQNLFYMEALWSRCLPAYESLKSVTAGIRD
jgi:dihydrodiol dehydrogenase / D-xylose 1-dehydrogenase (NADP)